MYKTPRWRGVFFLAIELGQKTNWHKVAQNWHKIAQGR